VKLNVNEVNAQNDRRIHPFLEMNGNLVLASDISKEAFDLLTEICIC
jgi:hypothetical protein